MLTLAVLILLIVVVGALSWRTRNKTLPVKCCSHAAWPPDDISARPSANQKQTPSATGTPGA